MSSKKRVVEQNQDDKKDLFISFCNLLVVISISIYFFIEPGTTIKEISNKVYQFLGGPYLMSSIMNKPIHSFMQNTLTIFTKYYENK